MSLRSLSLGIFLLLPSLSAWAHEIRPAIVDIAFETGAVVATVDLNLEAAIAGIQPQHSDTDESDRAAIYNHLRSLPPDELGAEFQTFAPRFLGMLKLLADRAHLTAETAELRIPPVGDVDLARQSKILLRASLPAGAQSVTWAWEPALGPVIVRARGPASGDVPAPVVYSAYLKDGAASEPIPVTGPLRQDWTRVTLNYLAVGFTHILPKGLDHILFVVGLFLLNPKLKPLAWQITSFTVAHSVTLALAMLGIVRLSPAIVEPLIAASIIYVCVENVLSDHLQRWRLPVVFGFGLLHGLGFAGVLAEVGLQPGSFITGLIAFNLGVELGQLAVVALCFLAIGLWFRHRPFYRSFITIPASVAIACVAVVWFVERIGWI